MSPVASGGPPHTRAYPINGGGPVSSANGVKANGLEGMKGANRVFPHLDDLVAAKPEIDINSPMRKILQNGETLAKQADTHLDFRRPDIALQEYVKASIVAVEIIPRHKDYPSLQSDRGELHRLYTGLTKRINAQHSKFAEVKKVIQENNSRSGVKPTMDKSLAASGSPAPTSNGFQNSHTRSQSVQNPAVNGTAGTIVPRKKPPIQPKPDALHGNAIQPSIPNSSTSAQTDLAARFARLRSVDRNGAIQDPRIRTQPISIPANSEAATTASLGNYTTTTRPTGPREMPSVPKTLPSKAPMDVQIPGMPRPPDAIYSPARATDNTATANLPSSVPRSSSYRGQDSAPPISTVGPTPIPSIAEGRQDYFSPARSIQNNSYGPKYQKRQAPDLPDNTTVTAEDLMGYLKLGTQALRVLLVDVRSREDFDSGHIMSQSIICVEPITLRQGISGEQLGDSMIIAPDFEQNLYEQRDEFDLIVFYDQSTSTDVARTTGPGQDGHLHDFAKAVYDYGYEKRLKRRPMMLVGGLDAWVDLLGPSSLQTSFTGTPAPGATAQTNLRAARPIGRVPMASEMRRGQPTRRKTHSSRPLSKEEEKKWDETLREDSALTSPPENGKATPDELVYARTTEDFFRRYPELPPIQESMMSPVLPPPPRKTFHDEFVNTVPPPPARPAPALPRQRSSGLSERGPTATFAHSAGLSEPQTITHHRVTPGLTGLVNPGVLCYMNSAVQALSATPFLRELVLNHQHPANPPIPRKSNEASDPLQLMVRCFGNLLTHLWGGQYDWVTPKTLAVCNNTYHFLFIRHADIRQRYVNSIHAGTLKNDRVRDMAFGGHQRQHDSTEFLNWFIEILDDELNPKRNRPAPTIPDSLAETWNTEPLMTACQHAWNLQMSGDDSPIAHQMKGQYVYISKCPNCKRESRVFSPFTYLNLIIQDKSTQSVREILADAYGKEERLETFKCDACKRSGEATRIGYITKLPNYLVLEFNRYDDHMVKINTQITFREFGLDMNQAFVPASQRFGAGDDVGSNPPFLYDCYAVTQHRGRGIGGGHYWTIAKSLDKSRNNGKGAGAWHKFNDREVKTTTFQECQIDDAQTTTVFLKRQGID
jgi:ubiquitin carboxyl-terminal hydrolase 8